MTKVVTTKSNRAGQKVKISGILLEFDGNLTAEVSEEQSKVLVDSGKDIYLEGEVPKTSLELDENAPVKTGIPSPGEAKKMLEKRRKQKEEAKLAAEKELEAKEDSTEAPKEEDEALVENEEETPTESSKEDSDLGISELSVKELQSICESEKYPKSEWGKKLKPQLVEYLESKLKE
jgi:hypothetical protein